MPSTYSKRIGIEKPAPGEQEGTWGGTVNTDLDLIDQAISGIATITLASAGTTGAPNTITIENGELSDGRNKYIEFTDGADLGDDVYVQLVSTDDGAEKIVYIRNNLSGGRPLLLFQGTYSAARDYTVNNGNVAVVKFSGEGAGSSSATAVFSSLQVDGVALPNNTAIEWANAANDGVISVLVNTDDDIHITVNGVQAARFDSDDPRWVFNSFFSCRGITDNADTNQLTIENGSAVFQGTLSASNLSGTNTGDEAAASETVVGIIEQATQAEVDAGTAGNLAVTAEKLAAWTGGGGGTTSPLTTKGDLYCFSTVNARLPVGTNGFVLSADSSTATGLKWIASGTGGLGAVVEDLSPQLGGDLDGNNKWIDCTNTSAARGIRLYEPIGGGVTKITIIAPSMSADWTLTLPSNDGISGQVLRTNGAGICSWISLPSSQTPAILSNGSTPSLNTGITASEVRTLIGAGTGDGDGTVTSVGSGNGMSFTSITGSGSVTLGSPTSVTASSTNTVTTSSHTHAIDSSIARIASPTFTGTVTAPVFNATSARYMKEEVFDVIDAENLLSVNPICYTLNDDPTKKVMMGAFADEMVKLFPQCVSVDKDGEPNGIDYSRLVIPLIMKIQDLEERLRSKGI